MVAKRVARRNKVEELLGEEGEVLDVVRTDPPDVVTPTVEPPVEEKRMTSPFKQKLVEYDERFDEDRLGEEAKENLKNRAKLFSDEYLNVLSGGVLDDQRLMQALRQIHIKNPDAPTDILAAVYSGIPEEIYNLSNKRIRQVGLGKPIQTNTDSATGVPVQEIKASDLVKYFNKITDRKTGVLDLGEVNYLLNNKLLRNKLGIKLTDTTEKTGRKVQQVSDADDKFLNLEDVREKMRELEREGHADYTIHRDATTKEMEGKNQGNFDRKFNRFHRKLGQNQIMSYPEKGYESLTINAKGLPINVLRKDKHNFRGDSLGHTRLSLRDMRKDTVKQLAQKLLTDKRFAQDKSAEQSVKNIDAFVNALSRFRNMYEKSRAPSNVEFGYTSPDLMPVIKDTDSIAVVREKMLQGMFNQTLSDAAHPVGYLRMKYYAEGLKDFLMDRASADAMRVRQYRKPSQFSNEEDLFVSKYGIDQPFDKVIDGVKQKTFGTSLQNVLTTKQRLQLINFAEDDSMKKTSSFLYINPSDLPMSARKVLETAKREAILKELYENEQIQDLINHPNFDGFNDGFRNRLFNEQLDEDYVPFHILKNDPAGYDQRLLSEYPVTDPLYMGRQVLDTDEIKSFDTRYSMHKNLMEHIKKLQDKHRILDHRIIDEDSQFSRSLSNAEELSVEEIERLNRVTRTSYREAIEKREELIDDLLGQGSDSALFKKGYKSTGSPIFSGYGIDDVEEVLDELKVAFEKFDEQDTAIIDLDQRFADGETWSEKLINFENKMRDEYGLEITKKFLHDYQLLEAYKTPKFIDTITQSAQKAVRQSEQKRAELLSRHSRPMGVMSIVPEMDRPSIDPALDVDKYIDQSRSDYMSVLDLMPEERTKVVEAVRERKRNIFNNEVLIATVRRIRHKLQNNNRVFAHANREFSTHKELSKEIEAKEKELLSKESIKREALQAIEIYKRQMIRRASAEDAYATGRDIEINVEDFKNNPASFINDEMLLKDVAMYLDMITMSDSNIVDFSSRFFSRQNMDTLATLRKEVDDAYDDLLLKGLNFHVPTSPFRSPFRDIFEQTSNTHEKYFVDFLNDFDLDKFKQPTAQQIFESILDSGDQFSYADLPDVFNEKTINNLIEMADNLNIPMPRLLGMMPQFAKYKFKKDKYNQVYKTLEDAAKDALLTSKFQKRYTDVDVDNFLNRAKQAIDSPTSAKKVNVSELVSTQLEDSDTINYDNVEFLSRNAPSGPNKIDFSNSAATHFLKEDIREWLNRTEGYKEVKFNRHGRMDDHDILAAFDDIALSQDMFAGSEFQPDSGFMNLSGLTTNDGKHFFVDKKRKDRRFNQETTNYVDLNTAVKYGDLTYLPSRVDGLKEAYSKSPMKQVPIKLKELSQTGGDIDGMAFVMEELQSDIHNEIYRDFGQATIKAGESPIAENHVSYVKRLILASVIMAKKKGVDFIVIPNYQKQREVRGTMPQDIVRGVYKKGVPRAVKELSEDSGNLIKEANINDLMYADGETNMSNLLSFEEGILLDVRDFEYDVTKGDMLRMNEGGLAA